MKGNDRRGPNCVSEAQDKPCSGSYSRHDILATHKSICRTFNDETRWVSQFGCLSNTSVKAFPSQTGNDFCILYFFTIKVFWQRLPDSVDVIPL